MLQKWRDIALGKSVAVIGSAPSAILFKGQEDLAVGVNGAATLLRPGDFFVSMYKGAHKRDWIHQAVPGVHYALRPHSAIYLPWMFHDESLRQRLVDWNEAFMDRYPTQVRNEQVGDRYIKYVSKEYEPAPRFLSEFPDTDPPHIAIKEIDLNAAITKDVSKINPFGTSSCTALQIAFIMGAREIHIYGVEFSNDIDDPAIRSFYERPEGELSLTPQRHRIAMDSVISIIRNAGVPVYIHGWSRLQAAIKLHAPEHRL